MKRVRIEFTCPQPLAERLKATAEAEGSGLSEMIRTLIREAIAARYDRAPVKEEKTR